MSTFNAVRLIAAIFLLAGCSRGPERFQAPSIDTSSAAAQAIELYDSNGDGALDDAELIKCPGMLAKITTYDANGNGSVESDEIEKRLARMLNRTGGTPLVATITYKGRKLAGAEVVLEPEPYLGGEVQSASGVTTGAGTAELTIPPEIMPEHLRRLKMVHYGTFKVRITHPSISIPAKYNAETELGYETEAGNPSVRFDLK